MLSTQTNALQQANALENQSTQNSAAIQRFKNPMGGGDPSISATVGKTGENHAEDVKTVQRFLKHKYGNIKVTGVCDAPTIKAIEDFQKSIFQGWSDGNIAPNQTTWKHLLKLQNQENNNPNKKKKHIKPPLNPKISAPVGRGQTNNPNDVTTVQKLLNYHGITVPVNGVCDDATIKAIEAFQIRELRFQDGVVGIGPRALTWPKLIAGLAKDEKKSNDKPIPGITKKLTGASILYVFLEDSGAVYDYDQIKKDVNDWDYIMGKNFDTVVSVLKQKYGNKEGFITDLVIRSHGYSYRLRQHGPTISGSTLSNLKNQWDTRVKSMEYLRSLLTGEAKILFTACSVVQEEKDSINNIVKDYGEFFLKGTDRSLFLNRTKTSSRHYHDDNENGEFDRGKEKEYINFDGDMVKADKGKSIWAGYLWINYDKKENRIVWKDNYYNVELDSEDNIANFMGIDDSAGIVPSKMSELPVKIASKHQYYDLDSSKMFE